MTNEQKKKIHTSLRHTLRTRQLLVLFFFFAFDLIIFKRQTPQVYVAETIAHTMKMQAQFH